MLWYAGLSIIEFGTPRRRLRRFEMLRRTGKSRLRELQHDCKCWATARASNGAACSTFNTWHWVHVGCVCGGIERVRWHCNWWILVMKNLPDLRFLGEFSTMSTTYCEQDWSEWATRWKANHVMHNSEGNQVESISPASALAVGWISIQVVQTRLQKFMHSRAQFHQERQLKSKKIEHNRHYRGKCEKM